MFSQNEKDTVCTQNGQRTKKVCQVTGELREEASPGQAHRCDGLGVVLDAAVCRAVTLSRHGI